MNPLVSSLVSGIGKSVVNAVSSNNSSHSIRSRGEQIEQFQDRLDFALNPQKAEFKRMLDQDFIQDINGVEFLSNKLKDALLSDPTLTGFVSENGGLSGDFSIEKRGSDVVLTSQLGNEWVINGNSELGKRASHLYRLESIKQLASIQPGLSLDHLIDLSFRESSTT